MNVVRSVLSRLGRRRNAVPAPLPRPVRVERRHLCLADLDGAGLRALVQELDGQAQEIGCVVFDGPKASPGTVVIFAGNLERFHMLSAARHLTCKVVYVQDVFSWWYQGSDLLPDLDTFCERFLVGEVARSRALFFGQSSGAYAAIAASTHFVGSTVVACAPQTFSDARVKSAIRFVGIRPLSAPDGLIDLRQRLLERPDPTAFRAVVIAAGELDNPATAHWWGDYIHLLRIAELGGVTPFIVNSNTHVLVHSRAAAFATLLARLMHCVETDPADRDRIVTTFLQDEFDVSEGGV